MPLYRYVGGVFARILPVPMMNIINGGRHADNPTDVQEFMIVPVGMASATEAIRAGSEIFHALRKKLVDAGHNTNVGDEGGFAPNLASTDAALGFITQAIEAAGYHPGDDVVLALDPAASEFYRDGAYRLSGEGKTLDAAGLVVTGPISSDGIRSSDRGRNGRGRLGWLGASQRELGGTVQLVGDDVFVTNPTRLRDGMGRGAANALLVKVNQIGTLETLDGSRSRNVPASTVFSHRSRNRGYDDRRSGGGD